MTDESRDAFEKWAKKYYSQSELANAYLIECAGDVWEAAWETAIKSNGEYMTDECEEAYQNALMPPGEGYYSAFKAGCNARTPAPSGDDVGWFIPLHSMSSLAQEDFEAMMKIIKHGGMVDVSARVDGKEYQWQCDGLKYAKKIAMNPAQQINKELLEAAIRIKKQFLDMCECCSPDSEDEAAIRSLEIAIAKAEAQS